MNNQEAPLESEFIGNSSPDARNTTPVSGTAKSSSPLPTNSRTLRTTAHLSNSTTALVKEEKPEKKIVSPERSSLRHSNSIPSSETPTDLSSNDPQHSIESNLGDYLKSPGTNQHLEQERDFPRTPQFDHLYLDLENAPAVPSVSKRVRLANDVILTPKRSYFPNSPRRTLPNDRTTTTSISSTAGNRQTYNTAEGRVTTNYYREVPTVTPSRKRINATNISSNESFSSKTYKSTSSSHHPAHNSVPQRNHYTMSTNASTNESPNKPSELERRNIEPSGKLATHVISQNAVELILKRPEGEGTNSGPYTQMTRGDDAGKKSSPKKVSPPRTNQSAEEKEANANVVTPMEVVGHGHNRSSSYTSSGFEPTLSNAPESPHPSSYSQQNSTYYNMPSPYPSSDPQGYYDYEPSPSKGEVEQPPTPQGAYASNSGYYPPTGQGPPHYYSNHAGYPPHSREAYFATDYDSSPGKRQRLAGATSREEESKRGQENNSHGGELLNGSNSGYHGGRGHNRKKSPGSIPVTDSFDSGEPRRYTNVPGPFPIEDASSPQRGPRKIVHPPVLKSSSYPPPQTNHPYRTGGESASSYSETKGQVKHQSMNDAPRVYPGPPIPPRGSQSYYQGEYYGSAQRYEPGAMAPPEPFYPSARGSHGHEPPSPQVSGGFYPGDAGNDAYYPRAGPPIPQDDVHPLMRNYDSIRDRRPPSDDNTIDDVGSRKSNSSKSKPKAGTPSRKGKKAQDNSGGDSKNNSPKRKPGSAAQAAIAAGMTQPPSAREVDFDIHNPPTSPQIPPSTQPICAIPSNVNSHDVLCGRGGGTNTQIGNRRFRSLVHEFQPTYLLCRRKEKPLIARTIVLIIRNRGGRFLKKDEVNGMLFEVGDDKAEAKTSQALREGLDVRSAKSPSAGKRKSRKKKADIGSKSKVKTENDLFETQETNVSDSGREGPPPQDAMYQYALHQGQPYYYAGGYPEHYYAPYGYPQQQPFSPTRKRPRGPPSLPPPPLDNGYPYSHQYPPKSYPHQTPAQEYYNYPPQTSEAPTGPEEENIWEMDFSPPRSSTKKESGIKAEEHEAQQH